MVNDQFATYEDWPKSQSVLERFIARKYTGKALVSNLQTDITKNPDIDEQGQPIPHTFTMGEKVVGSTSSAFGFVINIDPTNKQLILNDIQGGFQAGETVTGSSRPKVLLLVRFEIFQIVHTITSTQMVIKHPQRPLPWSLIVNMNKLSTIQREI